MSFFSENIWQSSKWENFQKKAKNTCFWEEKNNAKALIIQRDPHFLKFWKKPLWEIPRGPIGDLKNFEELFKKIFENAKKQGIKTVRVYPPFGNACFWEMFQKTLEKFSHINAPEIFPQHTLILDIEKNEEEILAQMKQKGRYNIKLAKKRGVEVFEEKNIENFWRILQETAKRDGFTSNKKNIYEAMVASYKKNAIVLSAKDTEGEILASKIFIADGENAVYYYGASSSRKRNLMAPYLLQWEGILWAKKMGAKKYDFLGISPEEDKKHQLASVSSFKHKFGGTRVICDKGIDFLL